MAYGQSAPSCDPLKVQSIHFHCCSKSLLTLLIGWILWRMVSTLITSCAGFSYVIHIFKNFPMYGNEQMTIVTINLHTSFAQYGSILSLIRIPASSIPKRNHRSFTVNFTMLKENNFSSSEASVKKLTSLNCTF